MAAQEQKTLKIDVKTPAGKVDGAIELPAELFDVPANIALMHQVVTAQRAAARQGTHSTKTRGEVSGGGRKPYRQKGTASTAPPSLTTVPRRAGMRRDGPQGHLIGPAIAVNRHRRIRVSPTRPVKPIRVPMSPRRSRMTRSVGPSRPTADERSIRCRSWIRAAHLLVSVCSTSNVPRPRCANCCTRSARIRIGTAW